MSRRDFGCWKALVQTMNKPSPAAVLPRGLTPSAIYWARGQRVGANEVVWVDPILTGSDRGRVRGGERERGVGEWWRRVKRKKACVGRVDSRGTQNATTGSY